MINILMTTDTLGGIWHYCLELFRQSRKYPVRFHLATMGASMKIQQKKELAFLGNVVWYESEFKMEWMEDSWEDVAKASKWLSKLEKKINPDLIHLNNFSPAFISSHKPVIAVIHSCVLSWWRAVKGENAPKHWNRYKLLAGRVLHAADLVVAPSNFMMKEAESIYGPFLHKKVIYNGIDAKRFKSEVKEPFILSIGRIWDEAKNISLLAEAAPKLPWPIVVAGEGKNPQHSEEVTFSNIHFTGQQTEIEIAALLSKASIYVAPAKYEPFGLAVAEAAMSGCALVVGRTPAMKELWGDAAIAVSTVDVQELVDQVVRLVSNHSFRERQIRKSRKRAQKFHASRMARRYHHIYFRMAEHVNLSDHTSSIRNF